jgi:hypothetical protein
MKEGTQQSQKNAGNDGGGVFGSGRKGRWEHKKASAPLCQRKTDGRIGKADWKRLANMWRRRKITKKPRAVRGQEPKWVIPVEMSAQ